MVPDKKRQDSNSDKVFALYLLQVSVADLSEEAPAVEKLARMTVFVYSLRHQRS